MKLPWTLSCYLGRQFLRSMVLTLVIVLGIIYVVELLDHVRRAADTARGVPFHLILEMALLKLPTTAERIYPFTILVGAMVALARLARSSELVVTRAAGVSVWQFLLPGVVVAASLGVLFVTVVNPVAASSIKRYERIESKYITGSTNMMVLTASGLWLRQTGEEGISFAGKPAAEYILYAARMDQTSYALAQVMILLFDDAHRFLGRIDAPSAQLATGQWEIAQATLSSPGVMPQQHALYRLPTRLTLTQIQDSFSDPETFSFWELPGFIAVLEKAGFSALHHKLHFHSLIALPLLLAGMTLLAAVFSLRPPRRGGTGVLVVTGLAAGFTLYFLTNLIYALGGSGTLPITLAAWAPSLIVAMLSGAMLLHLEDG